MQKSEKLNESSQKKGWTKRWNMLLLMEEIRLTSWYGGPTIIYLQDFSQQQQHFKVQWTFLVCQISMWQSATFSWSFTHHAKFCFSSLLNIFFSPISGAPPHVFKVSKQKQTKPTTSWSKPNLIFLCPHIEKWTNKNVKKWGYTTFEKAPGEPPVLQVSLGRSRSLGPLGRDLPTFDSLLMYLPNCRFITPPKFNIAPENRESQKETHLPTIHFQGASC